MDLIKYLTVLVVFFFEGGESGGHGGKHHDHVKLHVPEFIHHDFHTKVITIHHHHQKPKKEHQHHHHHYHHKPHIPHGHHYHHHHKKSHTTHTSSKGHDHSGHHGHHGHHIDHGHQNGHHGHGHEYHGHGHEHGHGHGHHHHDTPSINYSPSSTSFEEDYGPSFIPSVPSYSGGIIPQAPKVHGVTHTVKQVKVFDSLPGVIPTNAGVSHGYEVTEEGEEDDDTFTSINSLQQTYPATYGYLRGAAPEFVVDDPFASLFHQSTIQANNQEPFAAVPQPTSGLAGEESFMGVVHNDPFTSSAPANELDYQQAQISPELPISFQPADAGFDNPANSFIGEDAQETAFLAADDKAIGEETPVNFSREAGVQQSYKTGGLETIVF